MESPECRAAFVAGRALDPTTLIDEEGNTLLHNAKTEKEITLLLKNPLSGISAKNNVRTYIIKIQFTHFHMTHSHGLTNAILLRQLGWPNTARSARKVARAAGSIGCRRS